MHLIRTAHLTAVVAPLIPLGLILLGSCAAHTVRSPDWSTRAEVQDLLARSAQRAATAQETLAALERARVRPAPTALDETTLPPELQRLTSVEWSGPGEEAVRQIAREIGYEFRATGNPPPIPAMIHISRLEVPVAKALEEIGHQVHPRAEVIVDPNL